MADYPEIEADLRQAFPDAELDLVSEDGHHFALTIAAQAFQGKSRVEQHRMVYAALGERVGAAMHALQLKTIVKE